jgi:hypothetical protein
MRSTWASCLVFGRLFVDLSAAFIGKSGRGTRI